jgi:hypothetical protein
MYFYNPSCNCAMKGYHFSDFELRIITCCSAWRSTSKDATQSHCRSLGPPWRHEPCARDTRLHVHRYHVTLSPGREGRSNGSVGAYMSRSSGHQLNQSSSRGVNGMAWRAASGVVSRPFVVASHVSKQSSRSRRMRGWTKATRTCPTTSGGHPAACAAPPPTWRPSKLPYLLAAVAHPELSQFTLCYSKKLARSSPFALKQRRYVGAICVA